MKPLVIILIFTGILNVFFTEGSHVLVSFWKLKITLEGLAAYLGFSPSYCSKYIKRKCGMNFLEYLNIQRVERARELLRATDIPVTEIAWQTGFSSLQSFNRVFRSYVSMSPSEYKKSVV